MKDFNYCIIQGGIESTTSTLTIKIGNSSKLSLFLIVGSLQETKYFGITWERFEHASTRLSNVLSD
jgi:hypothetical protein